MTTGHAKTTGVVNDDEIGAAGLSAFRRQPGASAGADDGLALRQRLQQPRQRFLSGHRRLSPNPRNESNALNCQHTAVVDCGDAAVSSPDSRYALPL